ncbi:hypothetical protein AAFF_G00440470 [Aldrovandia affinis]|uniref:C2 domain-containing protein n=1 Tax=Aldrovandia affinis TaxID=143900 RepID=A0AAD7WHQ4_9TELE|nr:hypothetical protein AAFF_G00440470 [Aldrovandia affinis]
MLEEIGWVTLVAVFLVSVLTVLAWLVQYSVGGRNAGAASWVLLPLLPRNLRPRVLAQGAWGSLRKLRFGRGAGARDVAGAKGVLSSLFSFRSFRESSVRAWVRALNEQACRHGSSIQIHFEDGLQLPSCASIGQVTYVDQSASTMVLQCDCTVDTVTFSVTVTQQSPATVSIDTYQVTIAPVQAQLVVCLEEVEEEEGLLVSWSFSEQPPLCISVSPCRVQREECEEKVDVNTIRDLVENAIISTHPAMMVHLKACVSASASPGKRQNRVRSSPARAAPVQRILVHQLRATGLRGRGGHLVRLGDLCCVLELDPPTQEARSSFLPSPIRPGAELEWEEDLALDLDVETKGLKVRLVERNSDGEKFLPGHASIPLDLPRRAPIGQQVLSVSTGPRVPPTATVIMELLFLESGDAHKCQGDPRPRTSDSPAPEVETDHNSKSAGKIVTPTRTVQTQFNLDCKPGSPFCSPHRVGRAESAALRASGGGFSPTTSLKMPFFNGLDPPDDTAIRHLTMKGPPLKRKSNIITAKGPIAAGGSACSIGCAAPAHTGLQGEYSPGGNNCDRTSSQRALRQDRDEAARSSNSERPSTDDMEYETGSTGALETRSLKDHKVGFLRGGTKLLFRRRARQKDPSLSRSHEDISDTGQASLTRKKSGSFSRRLIKRFSFHSRSKSKTGTNANGAPATADD